MPNAPRGRTNIWRTLRDKTYHFLCGIDNDAIAARRSRNFADPSERQRIVKSTIIWSLVAALCLTSWPAAGAAPLADRVPADVLVYVGWSGRTLTLDGSMLGQLLLQEQFRSALTAARSMLGRGRDAGKSKQIIDEAWDVLSAVWQRPTALAVLAPGNDEPRGLPPVVLLIDSPGRDTQLDEQVEAVLRAAWPEIQITEAAHETTTYKTCSIGPGGRISFGYLGGVFFICSGKDTPARLIGLSAIHCLGAREDFSKALEQVAGPDEQLVLFADLAELRATTNAQATRGSPTTTRPSRPRRGQPVHKLIAAMGLDQATVLVGTTRIVERGLYTKVRVLCPAPHGGLLALASGRAISDDDLGGIAADATFVVATSLQPESLLDRVGQIAAVLSPRGQADVKRALDEFSQRLGASLDRDILASLGDTAILASAPSYGGFLTGTVFAVRVKNADKLSAALEKVQARLTGRRMDQPDTRSATAPASANYRLGTIKTGSADVHFIVPTGTRQWAVIPAWAINKGWVYLAAWPQVIQSAIEESETPGLVQDADFRRLRTKVSPRASALIYVNQPQILTMTYGLRLPICSMLLARAMANGSDQTPVPWLMPLSKLRKYTWPSIAAISHDAEGITIEAYGSGTLPIATGLSASLSAMVYAIEPAR